MENAEAEFVRDNDELEGSLFLPVATAVNEPIVAETVAVAVGATPTTYFNYETAVAEEEEQEQQYLLQQQQQQEEEQAFAIPSTSSEFDANHHQGEERIAFHRGNRNGIVAAEEERDAIRSANRRVYSVDYYAQQQVKAANERARRRAQEERLAVRASRASGAAPGAAGGYELELWEQQQEVSRRNASATAATASSSQSNNTNNSHHRDANNTQNEAHVGGGYQVNEYQIGSYDTNEYNVSEYKSVYD